METSSEVGGKRKAAIDKTSAQSVRSCATRVTFIKRDDDNVISRSCFYQMFFLAQKLVSRNTRRYRKRVLISVNICVIPMAQVNYVKDVKDIEFSDAFDADGRIGDLVKILSFATLDSLATCKSID